MDGVLRLLKKLIPAPLFRAFSGPYHFCLAYFASVWHGRPSRRMYVIGVTGTKGKTTTCHLITGLLEALGKNVGMTSSVQFRLGEIRGKIEKRVNDTKQGMPGRFRLQKLLRKMADNKCEYAVIETTSEGMLQYRHRFIDYRMAVFTNLSPEHIERHGGFVRYRDTKVKLFEKIARKKDGVGVYNLDDENVGRFLQPNVSRRIGFALKDNFSAEGGSASGGQFSIYNFQSIFNVSNIKLKEGGSEFDIKNVHFSVPLIGEFNVYNAAAAVAAVSALGFSLQEIVSVAGRLHSVVGRSEIVQKEPFFVIVDYAHEPRSLEAIYKAATLFKFQIPNSKFQINSKLQDQSSKREGRLICLLGAQGGGRDKWKRAEMGKIAAKYCDEIVLTNEDPYDENPQQIIDDIERGVLKDLRPRIEDLGVYKIVDREEAIRKAISLAKPGDVVVLSGKGGEVWMCVEGGKKIPWDERGIVENILGNSR